VAQVTSTLIPLLGTRPQYSPTTTAGKASEEATVIAMPHPETGEIPKAFIVLRDEGKLTAEDIIKWTEDKLAHYKRPRAVEFRDELPKSAVGKILKRELKAEELKKLQTSAAKA
jgi:long-chain acyl-CoA synthetase